MNSHRAAIDRAYREEAGAVLATLIRQLGDFALAEDALHDAFAAAVIGWERDGVPDRPGAWLTTVARRRAIDRLRRERGLAERVRELGELGERSAALDELAADNGDAGPIADDQLRLIFTCCHPALAIEARVALTLRCLGGLTTPQLARAFLLSESTIAQRLVRAKRKIAVARIPYRVPEAGDLPERLTGVLAVVYLIFNEGYLASSGDALVRSELCDSSIRLGRLVAELLPQEPEARGLLALMLLTDSRRTARVGPGGQYVPLDEQDRSLWSTSQIEEGRAQLDLAVARRAPGRFQLQAAIAAVHADARSAAQTDWPQIAGLYEKLLEFDASPVVEVNRAVAVAFAGGDGLARLRPLLDDPRLAGYQPLHAAHAELLSRSGHRDAAATAYERAIELSSNGVEREWLRERAASAQARS